MTTAASCHYWQRVHLSLELCLKEAVIDVAINKSKDPSYVGLSSNAYDLYKKLYTLYQDKKHPLHKILKPKQWISLCPSSGQTNLQDCDLTQIIAVVRSENIVQPNGGWKIKTLQLGDTSLGAFMYQARELRNELNHGKIQDIATQQQFNAYWIRIKDILRGLGYKNMKRFFQLKTESLDPYGTKILTMMQHQYYNLEQDNIMILKEIENLKQRLDASEPLLSSKLKVLAIIACFVMVGVVAGFRKTTSLTIAREQLCKGYMRGQSIRKSNFYPFTKEWRKRFHIQLSLHDGDVFHKEDINMDLDFNRHKMLNPSSSNVNINNILDQSNESSHLIFLSGAGGMGKTYTMESAVLSWCQHEIWPSIKFVFLFKFRIINYWNYSSFKEMLTKEYKEVSNYIDWDELSTIGENIVILLDGVDEFIGLNELDFNPDPVKHFERPTTQAIMELIDPMNKKLTGCQLIITGRPFAVQTLCERLATCNEPIYPKVYDVQGFNATQVDEYIKTFTQIFPQTTSAIHDFKSKLRDSKHLQLMSTTPVLLWSLCELYGHNDMKFEVATKTELYALQMTIFLYKHLKIQNKTKRYGKDIFEIYDSSDVQNLVHSLGKLASNMHKKNLAFIRITKELDILPLESLEISGIVSQVELSSNEKYIQFYHLSIQEFLTALHDLKVAIGEHDKKTKEYVFIEDMFFGLLGALDNHYTGSKILKLFLHSLNITVGVTEDFCRKVILRFRSSNPLEAVYEYKTRLPNHVICDFFSPVFTAIDSFYLQHYLDKYNTQCISKLSIRNGKLSADTLSYVCGINTINLLISSDIVEEEGLSLLINQLLQCTKTDHLKEFNTHVLDIGRQENIIDVFNAYHLLASTAKFKLVLTGFLWSVRSYDMLYRMLLLQRLQGIHLQSLNINMIGHSCFSLRRYKMLAEMSLYVSHFFMDYSSEYFDEEQFKYFLNVQSSLYRSKQSDGQPYPILLKSVTLHSWQTGNITFHLFPITETKLHWDYKQPPHNISEIFTRNIQLDEGKMAFYDVLKSPYCFEHCLDKLYFGVTSQTFYKIISQRTETVEP